MRRILVFISVIAIVVLVSCTTPVSTFSGVNVGMTKEAVLAMCGEPTSRAHQDGTDYFIYNNVSVASFSDDIIDYKIGFKDGKVVSYGQSDYHAKESFIFGWILPLGLHW